MLSKIFESLYVKVLVNIVLQKEKTLVYIEVRSHKKLLRHAYMDFPTTQPNDAMKEFIFHYTHESPYFYISFLDNATEQGALPTCTKSKLSYYYDLSESEYRCFNNNWSFYTAKSDLYTLEKKFSSIGVDFIFSPFVVLYNFFKDKVSSNIALFVLIQEDSISLSVFEHNELLYAKYMQFDLLSEGDILSENNGSIEDDISDLDDISFDDSIDLEDIDVDDQIESLEDFGDIEDLDSIEDIDQFSENKDIEEELFESEDRLEDGDEEHFQEDYQRFSLIEKGVGLFYADERYKSTFIENIYIADSMGVSNDLKRYLEEEMFLNVYIRKIDLSVEVCELTKEELML